MVCCINTHTAEWSLCRHVFQWEISCALKSEPTYSVCKENVQNPQSIVIRFKEVLSFKFLNRHKIILNWSILTYMIQVHSHLFFLCSLLCWLLSFCLSTFPFLVRNPHGGIFSALQALPLVTVILFTRTLTHTQWILKRTLRLCRKSNETQSKERVFNHPQHMHHKHEGLTALIT